MSIGSLYPYERDLISVKKYGDKRAKVSYLSVCRVSGFEDDRKVVPKGSVNDCKLDNNISRSKARVLELALCNPWEYWCTFTISPEKYDRYNLKKYKYDFMEFIHNLNKRRKVKLTYILIPEMHADGAWHMHGFINGLQDSDLSLNDNGYFTWDRYNEKFGFMSLSKIKDKERCAYYSLKYMTKDISKNVSELGAHLFYASHGLKGAETVFRGQGVFHGDWDWIHHDGYVKVAMLDLDKITLEECIEVLC